MKRGVCTSVATTTLQIRSPVSERPEAEPWNRDVRMCTPCRVETLAQSRGKEEVKGLSGLIQKPEKAEVTDG